MSDTVTVKIDRPRKLRFTQRSKYRLSKLGLASTDWTSPGLAYSNLCGLVVALIDEPNVTLTPEDVAVAIDGREEEVSAAVVEIMNGIQPAEDDDPGKSTSPDGPSGSSNSESPEKNTGG